MAASKVGNLVLVCYDFAKLLSKTLHHHKKSRKRYIIEDCTCKVSWNECTGSISKITRQKSKKLSPWVYIATKTTTSKRIKHQKFLQNHVLHTNPILKLKPTHSITKHINKANDTNFEIGLTDLPAKWL